MTRTAIEEYARLEATGLWRPGVGQERQEVVVSLGEASLVLKDMADRPLAHWSLAATETVEQDGDRVVLTPGAGEMLTLDDPEMAAAIARVGAALNRPPRRLRLGRWTGLVVVLAALATALALLPDMLREDIAGTQSRERDEGLSRQIEEALEQSGRLCEVPTALRRDWDLLGRRAGLPSGARFLVVRDGTGDAVHLANGGVVVPETLLQDVPTPEALAARVTAAKVREGNASAREIADRLALLGLVRLWTRSTLSEAAAEAEATRILEGVGRPDLDPAGLEAAFAVERWLAMPYAQSVPEPDGQALRTAAEAAGFPPFEGPSIPDDQTWVALQEVCAL